MDPKLTFYFTIYLFLILSIIADMIWYYSFLPLALPSSLGFFAPLKTVLFSFRNKPVITVFIDVPQTIYLFTYVVFMVLLCSIGSNLQ